MLDHHEHQEEEARYETRYAFRPPQTRLASAFLVVLISSFTVARAFAQTTASSSVRRDAKAIEVLSAVEKATGWGSSGGTHDATAIGSLNYFDAMGGGTHNYIVRAMREGRVRIEIGDYIVTRKGTQLSEQRKGKTSALQVHMAPSLIPAPFPFWTALELWRRPQTELRYEGTQQIDNEQIDIVEIVPLEMMRALQIHDRKLIAQIFYISQQTSLPRRLILKQPSPSTPLAYAPVAYDWRGYQQFGNMLLPTKILQMTNGTKLFEVDIQDVTWNSGLNDFSFALSN